MKVFDAGSKITFIEYMNAGLNNTLMAELMDKKILASAEHSEKEDISSKDSN